MSSPGIPFLSSPGIPFPFFKPQGQNPNLSSIKRRAKMSSGAEVIVKNRFLGFLIWQSIPSTIVFILLKTLFLAPFGGSSSTKASIFFAFLTFLTFHLSQLIFSVCLSVVSSLETLCPASPLQLALFLLRFLLFAPYSTPSDFRPKAKASLSFLLLVATAALSGFIAVVSVCCGNGFNDDLGSFVGRAGFGGFVVGLLYGCFYVYNKRWLLEFPIVQRPLFYSFKMGLPSAIRLALKLSSVASLISAPSAVLLLPQLYNQVTVGSFITEQIVFFLGSFSVIFCWELSHHLHQVIHTKRLVFAPPKGSAAAEANPSEPLLATLEENSPNFLVKYLAHLDLCMVCENNVDSWRRAAFFEESCETYKRVIAVCLRPLEQLALKLRDGIEGYSDKGYTISKQLQAPTDVSFDLKCLEPLNNFKLYEWCARSAASLTACSHREDRFGVAQLSGSNAAVLSTLLSCLFVVEALMGKKTNLQPAHRLMGPASIKWATFSSEKKEVRTVKRRSGPVYLKAYAMADVLKISVYIVVSSFHKEMLASAKAGQLDKDWIVSEKPIFGTRELLLEKLKVFLDYRVS